MAANRTNRTALLKKWAWRICLILLWPHWPFFHSACSFCKWSCAWRWWAKSCSHLNLSLSQSIIMCQLYNPNSPSQTTATWWWYPWKRSRMTEPRAFEGVDDPPQEIDMSCRWPLWITFNISDEIIWIIKFYWDVSDEWTDEDCVDVDRCRRDGQQWPWKMSALRTVREQQVVAQHGQ